MTTDADPRAAISSVGTPPDGLTLTDNGDGTAILSGTPTAPGTYTVTLAAENIFDFGNPVTTTLTVVVQQAPSVTSPAVVGLGEGATGSFTITTGGYPSPSIGEAGTLPPGITFTDNGNGTATLTGVPRDQGVVTYPITVTAHSAAGQATQQLDIEIGPLPAFTSATTATFAVGKAGSFSVVTSGLPAASLSISGTLPAGLTFTDKGDGTGTLGGTPTGSGGLTNVVVTASNIYGTRQQNLAVVVGSPPAFLGSPTGLTCATGTFPDTASQFISGNTNSWTLCASSYPAPSFSLQGALPAGLTFIGHGDGSATISGSAANGTAGTYPLTLTLTNAAGSTTQALTLTIVQQVETVNFPDAPTFVAGFPNSYLLQFTGSPTPTVSFCSGGPHCTARPSWLSLVDHGDGTATLSGTPPGTTAGKSFTVEVDATNGVANGIALDTVFITVAPLGFAAAAPPSATVGQAYAYQFTASGPTAAAATFAVAAGSTLPAGLSLAPTGKLSGTPTTVGTDAFSVVATAGSHPVTSPRIIFTVGAGPHALEIARFRTAGPAGIGDWFAQIVNTSGVTIPLTGWSLGVKVPGSATPILVTLGAKGAGALAPGATVVVAGPYFSMGGRYPATVTGPVLVSQPSGFEIVAPDRSTTDAAGETGAPAALVAGTGVAVPPITGEQGAYVRDRSGPSYVDTNNNAADFSFADLSPTSVQLSSSGNPSIAGSKVTYTATVSSATPGAGTPTGTVAFTDNGATVACSPVTVGSGGVANCSATYAAAGTHAIVATYSGAPGFSTSTSSTVTQAVNPTVPGAPTHVMATAGTGQATVSWTAPTTGGSAITSYTVTPYQGAAAQVPVTVTCPCTTTKVTVTGLTNGLPYTFTVAATNDAGGGVASAPSAAVTPATAPPHKTTPPSTTTASPAPPAPPAGTTQSQGAASTTPNGTAAASLAGTTVSAAGAGRGALTVAQYTGDPVTGAVSGGTGVYYDVKLSATASFSTVTVKVCALGPGGRSLTWWDGSEWKPFSEQTFDAGTQCVTATVGPTTSPSLAQMGGTPVAPSTLPVPSTGSGYWLASADGGIFAYGDAAFYGSAGSLHLNKAIVAMAVTPDGHGYWLASADGGIFAYGDAAFYGSAGSLHLNKPIVAMAATPDGHGYWLVAADGGIFAFGDAAFYGSAGNLQLNQPIVGLASAPDGQGYRLVAADGGIFAFGDAAFYGSAGSLVLNQPIIGMAAAPDGNGYWLVAADGGIFAFGDAGFDGSAGNLALNKPIVGMGAVG